MDVRHASYIALALLFSAVPVVWGAWFVYRRVADAARFLQDSSLEVRIFGRRRADPAPLLPRVQRAADPRPRPLRDGPG